MAQCFKRQAVTAGCRYAVLEVSSEGIKQHRHEFIDFSAAVFTNLTPEHIEAHGGFEKYRAAKAKFFAATKNIHIINIDDKNAEYFLKFPANAKYGYSNDRGQSSDSRGLSSVIKGEKLNLKLSLMGDFNIYNALAAIAVGLSQDIPLEICQKAVEKIKNVPGRMEIVLKEPFKAVVDYAVTPDALEGLYKTLKKEFSPSALICVFGACGGGRDKWKRPELGKIAGNYCNKIILTNEDPYDEEPIQIIQDIERGVINTQAQNLYTILDRRENIGKGVGTANGFSSRPKNSLGRQKNYYRRISKIKTMKSYEALPHRADLKIKVHGRNKKELFSNALLGMAESMKTESGDKAIRRNIKIKSIDFNALLVDFLSEALYLSQVNKEIYFQVNFSEFSDTEIKAELAGRKVKFFGEDIKAVTHHGLTIKEKNGHWEAEILFDI
ncbi:MAG: archease [Candidatus Nealsonbacteria bacterium]|nr:archease [Candidatus Nealsonbacteria bacterium]